LLPTWNDLELHAIDLHLHAGTERPEPCTLLDLVSYAVATGRRIMCLTDHWGRFLGLSRKPLTHYPGSVEGFREFAADVREAREKYPDLYLLLGPEAGFEHMRSGSIQPAFDPPEVDLFLGEPGGAPEGMRYGDYLINGIEAIAGCRDRYHRPGFLVHPLRDVINRVCGKSGPGPAHPKHPQFPPLGSYADPTGHVEEVLDIDIGAFADACVRLDVTVEINESDFGRILGQNHQSFADRYFLFYRALIDAGVSVVLGSDMHNVEHPACTPFVPATMLGVKPRDMRFLEHWLGNE
jgi:histidinol phosphatase-like PHP family hydrolase